MIILENLKPNECVQVFEGDKHISDIVSFPTLPIYLKNEDGYKSIGSPRQLQCEPNSQFFTYNVIKNKELICYTDDETHQKYSLEYKSELENLISLTDDELSKLSIEDELEHIRNVRLFKRLVPHYSEAVWEYVPIQFNVVFKTQSTGSDFITTSFDIGYARFTSDLRTVFSVSASAAVADEWSKQSTKYPNLKTSEVSHSNIRFHKINGKYVFHNKHENTYIDGKIKYRYFNTLGEARDFEERIRNEIEKIFKFETRSSLLVSELDCGKFLDEFKRMVNTLDKIKPMKQSAGELNSLKHKMKQFHDAFVEQAIESGE